MKKHSSEELQTLYRDAESIDAEIFAEQRSNVLLYAGDHYTRKSSQFYKRIRDTKGLNDEIKLRLTKNHIQFICDTYVNNIVAPNPGVGFSAKNEKEPHDQKVADMHHAVWRDAHERYHIDDKIDDWADSFVQVGEVCVKIYFDPMRGAVKAYDQKHNEDDEPVFLHPYLGETTDSVDELQQALEPAPDEEKALHVGEFVFEEIYGFNLLRPPECKDMREAEWLGTRKMCNKTDLKLTYPEHADKILSSQDETYTIFDTAKGGYVSAENQTMLTEYYFRPCHQYPRGYFYIATREVILAEGELPGGIFPIVFQAFRKFPTTPRGRSPIKTMRPYQAEINRSASKIAEHQITLGDDKLLIQNGTKISAGVALPGVRSINFSGMDPKILSGRTGDQYVNYMQGQIAELYGVMGVREDTEDLPAQLDPYSMLFRAARQKKKFQRYIKRFEKFLINIVSTYLSLAKVHFTDDMLVYAIGASERVNIPEFRESPDICYEINIEAQSEDVESKLGKQIAINQVLQYVGGKLKPEQLGQLMRSMPYSNFDESFDDMTLDYDNVVNDILALDRGEKPPINQYDPHPYMIAKLTNRMRKADFKYLRPDVQQNYTQKVDMHQQFEAMKQTAIQRAEQGLIPTGGYLTVCDLYVSDPSNPNKTQRVRLPSEAIQWLISHLQAQQSGLAPLADLSTGAQAQIAEKFTQASRTGPGPGGNSGAPQGPIGMSA